MFIKHFLIKVVNVFRNIDFTTGLLFDDNITLFSSRNTESAKSLDHCFSLRIG